MRHLIVLTTLILGSAPAVRAQELAGTDARNVFSRVAPSVFTVEVRDSTGRLIRTGTAFVTEGGRFVSNAHVVSPGRPSLRVGALAVPLSIQRLDMLNDLALLSVEARLDAPQLAIAPAPPAVGTRVYAIGNPQGLANSLSEGLVSGLRTIEGRELVQLTAAISGGSSGGPVVDGSGRVVGVIVATLSEGQNLNFAVPTDKLRQLLSGSIAGVTNFSTALAAARPLLLKDGPDISGGVEQWLAHRRWLGSELGGLRAFASTGDDFLTLATLSAEVTISDSTEVFAEQALGRGTGLPDSARALFLNATLLDLRFAEKDPVKARRVLREAELLLKSKPRAAFALSARALALHHLGRGPEAIAAARAARQASSTPDGMKSVWRDYHVITHEHGTGKQDDAAFEELRGAGMADAGAWWLHATHLDARNSWVDAGAAFEKAFDLSDSYEEYACRAGKSYWLAESADDALRNFRACLSSNAVSSYPDTGNIVYAHRGIAAILNDRGVHSQAEVHARQALRLGSGSEGAWAAQELARALRMQARPSEAVTAAEAAIRLSDGSHGSAHFELGQAYFDLKEWSRCAAAFRKADQTGYAFSATAHNIALCLARQSYFRDAANWMEIALQRSPTRSDRADLQAMIREWRAR